MAPDAPRYSRTTPRGHASADAITDASTDAGAYASADAGAYASADASTIVHIFFLILFTTLSTPS